MGFFQTFRAGWAPLVESWLAQRLDLGLRDGGYPQKDASRMGRILGG